MTMITFTAASQEVAIKNLRDVLAIRNLCEEFVFLTAARAEIVLMRTSTLLGFMLNPGQMAPWVAAQIGDDPDDDTLTIASTTLTLAICDEIDRRIPVPTGTIKACAEAIASKAHDIKMYDVDQNVVDCGDRIDKLCGLVSDLAMLVRTDLR